MPYKDPIKNKECIAKYFVEHNEEIKARAKLYREENKTIIDKKKKEYYVLNKNELSAKAKTPEAIKKRKAYELIYKDRRNYLQRVRRQQPSKKLQANQYVMKKYYNNVNFKISHLMRNRIKIALKHNSKQFRLKEIICCSIPELKIHIENQFKPGMSWDNYGLHGWHIDHIIPCSAFDLNDPNEQKKCFHYSNLQPLWAEENWAKGDKIIKN